MRSIGRPLSRAKQSHRHVPVVLLAATALLGVAGLGAVTGEAATTPSVAITVSGPGNVQVATTYRRHTHRYTVTTHRTLRVAAGTRVVVVEHPQASAVFAGWSGACHSTRATCAITVRKSTAIRASFRPTESVVNLPTTATNGESFIPIVRTLSDGVRSVTSNSPSVCKVDGSGKVNFVNVGTCSLTAHVAASRKYAAVTGGAQAFRVSRTPLIVDTDLFSSPDDVGALATAFGLQLNGKANVIAAVVNTRTDRPVVATNSWKCTAAIAQFYGSGNTLLGIDTAGTGTDSGSQNDFIQTCASHASLTTPTPAPNSAVSVYRRALASQPDHSVAIASIGYFENLEALLKSGADQFSPLNGTALVALKVNRLVAMAGCYPTNPFPAVCSDPSNNPENNFAGNAAAGSYVAANWPTKIVWSGYDVGTAVQTGGSLSDAHPLSSPVRAAYEQYFALDNPINHMYDSWDLTAVYHAVVPFDPALTEVGQGTNVVDPTTGVNTFTTNANGNQYYLNLTNVSGLTTTLNTLMDSHP
jgi:hypothetical protein